ncbi:MAG: glutamyl-tRNA reductase [Chitinophagales bacterium]
MYILVAGLSHNTAPVEVRERLALNGKNLEDVYEELKCQPVLEGVVVLSTCNRTEIYATVRDVAAGEAYLRNFFSKRMASEDSDITSFLYMPNCYDAIFHLFRVVSGLDSMVIGESQILGQVKDAYLTAIEQKASDAVLNALFQKAIYVGKRVRTETRLDQHAISISYTAVELARQVFGDLQGRSVLIVGAGEMSELAVSYLVANGVSTVIVSNRSYDNACCLAEKIKGKAIHLEELPKYTSQADIIISCTAANHYVLKYDNLGTHLESREKPILLIDIAVPRDIDPALGSIEGVHLFDIDDMKNVVDSNMIERRNAARKAQKIIEAEIEEFNNWMAMLYVVPVIKALKGKGEAIKEAEIKRTLNRIGSITPRQERNIRLMAESITNQLLKFPVENLKEIAPNNEGHMYAEVIRKLFELDIESEENKAYADNKGRVKG